MRISRFCEVSHFVSLFPCPFPFAFLSSLNVITRPFKVDPCSQYRLKNRSVHSIGSLLRSKWKEGKSGERIGKEGEGKKRRNITALINLWHQHLKESERERKRKRKRERESEREREKAKERKREKKRIKTFSSGRKRG